MERTFKEFIRRYYRWCLATAQREAESGFPRLAQMHTAPVLEYLHLVRAAPTALQLGIVNLFVKQRLLIESLSEEIDGDTLSSTERALMDRHQAHPRKPIAEDQRLETLEETNPHLFKINRREALQSLKSHVRNRGLELQRFDSASDWCCSQEIGGWTVGTDFQFGGRNSQFRYWHRIVGPDHYVLKGTVSIVSSMGIQGGAAIWNRCTTAELVQGIEHAVSACLEFLAAAPLLLRDLPLLEN